VAGLRSAKDTVGEFDDGRHPEEPAGAVTRKGLIRFGGQPTPLSDGLLITDLCDHQSGE